MTRLAVLGFGTMGQAITSGLVDGSVLAPADISVVAKGAAQRETAEALGVRICDTASAAAAASDAVLLAVKPKDLDPLLRTVAEGGGLDHTPLVISIAAGTRLAFLEERVPVGTAVVRAMPNTATSIRVGTTVLSPGQHADETHLAVARSLFEPLGAVLELEERHMDAVTSLSASGPAFIFVILEALAEGGVQVGLPRQVALELAARMTLGSATMVLQTGRHPASLKDDVTTPAGSTIAGLLALEDGRIRSVVARAVEQAAKVASGLGS